MDGNGMDGKNGINGPKMERVTGIEPVRSAWEADRLPLHHTRSRAAKPLLSH